MKVSTSSVIIFLSGIVSAHGIRVARSAATVSVAQADVLNSAEFFFSSSSDDDGSVDSESDTGSNPNPTSSPSDEFVDVPLFALSHEALAAKKKLDADRQRKEQQEMRKEQQKIAAENEQKREYVKKTLKKGTSEQPSPEYEWRMSNNETAKGCAVYMYTKAYGSKTQYRVKFTASGTFKTLTVDNVVLDNVTLHDRSQSAPPLEKRLSAKIEDSTTTDSGTSSSDDMEQDVVPPPAKHHETTKNEQAVPSMFDRIDKMLSSFVHGREEELVDIGEGTPSIAH